MSASRRLVAAVATLLFVALCGVVLITTNVPPARAVAVHQAAPGCERRVSNTTWGLQNPSGLPNDTMPVLTAWTNPDSCVEGGALFMFRDGFAADEVVHVGQWRHSSASQTWGFDIGAARPSGSGADAVWSVRRSGMSGWGPNEDYIIYGKRVYAMTSGTVVRCWRNAPDNPTPPMVDRWGGRIAGSGNFVVIQEPDGDRIWYAHARPGTISARLCPHSRRAYLAPSPDDVANQDREADVPPELQVWVNAGDYLFEVGNSGQSTNPHLHVHKHRGAAAQPVSLAFEAYAYQPVTGRAADARNGWIEITDQPLPPGPFVVRPMGIQAVPLQAPAARSWIDGAARYGTNIGGRIDLSAADPALCQQACLGEPNCRSWTYVRPGIQAELAVCWIKSDTPSPLPDDCCSTGDVPG